MGRSWKSTLVIVFLSYLVIVSHLEIIFLVFGQYVSSQCCLAKSVQKLDQAMTHNLDVISNCRYLWYHLLFDNI